MRNISTSFLWLLLALLGLSARAVQAADAAQPVNNQEDAPADDAHDPGNNDEDAPADDAHDPVNNQEDAPADDAHDPVNNQEDAPADDAQAPGNNEEEVPDKKYDALGREIENLKEVDLPKSYWQLFKQVAWEWELIKPLKYSKGYAQQFPFLYGFFALAALAGTLFLIFPSAKERQLQERRMERAQQEEQERQHELASS